MSNLALKIKESSYDDLYFPSEDEPFMNENQKQYFRARLLNWRNELLQESKETINHMQQHISEADEIDAACNAVNASIELRTRDRERKLINKIEEALRRIDDGTYGYCEETGDPISIKRLVARPIATLSIEAQERHERRERIHRDGF
jgi:DnaK suppressor protein